MLTNETVKLSPQIAAQEVDCEPLIDDVAASRLLGIHVKKLQSMCSRNEIPHIKIGKFWRFRASALDSWIKAELHDSCQPHCMTEPTS